MKDETENSGLRYRIDASRSNFTVQVFAEGMLSFMGHDPTFAVRRYGGEIRLMPDNTSVESMLIVVQANSLSIVDNVGKKDASEIENTMNAEVLEISKFPEIAFVSRDISMNQIEDTKYDVQINGILSLHNEKLAQTINTETEIVGKTIRAQGEFSLKQSDFNIEQVKALGGTLKVKDEVKISFDITAEI